MKEKTKSRLRVAKLITLTVICIGSFLTLFIEVGVFLWSIFDKSFTIRITEGIEWFVLFNLLLVILVNVSFELAQRELKKTNNLKTRYDKN